MREHTITTMRAMLSSQDSQMLSDLKDKERNKFRELVEARLRFSRQGSGKLFSRTQVLKAAKDAGVTNQTEVNALASLLSTHPEVVLNSVFWKTIGRGAASAIFHGKFDTSYSPGEVGGPLSRKASSLERIGGKIGTGIYKAGRTLQKAEKWFNVSDKDQAREYSRDSAFSQERRGAIDACIKQRMSLRGGPDSYVGYEMGSPGYEQCVNDASHQADIREIKRNAKHYKHLPDVLRELGVDPDAYLKTRRDEFTYKRGKYHAKRGKHLRGR